MHAFDASSMIYAWDNYPIDQFPGVWTWFSREISDRHITISTVAMEEVKNKTPDCGTWLDANQIYQTAINNAILVEALRIKAIIGIINDHYHSKGVGENDILIIASAKLQGAELVSDEERQPIPPTEPRKQKIPAVCKIPTVNVHCINFIEYIKSSKTVFR